MLKILGIYFYFMVYYNTFQKKIILKIWDHRTHSLSGGPNIPPPPKVSCIIQYKKFRNNHDRFDDAILLVWGNLSLKC